MTATEVRPAAAGTDGDRARLALVLSALLFGSTFAPQQRALDDLSPYGAVAIRFGVAALVVLPFLRADLPAVRERRGLYLRAGIIAGLINTVGFLVISAALERTTASKTAFLSSLSVVIVPVAAAILARRWPSRPMFVGIGLAVVGSFVLSGATLSIASGDALALGDAFIASAHIMTVAVFAPKLLSMPFNVIQLVVSFLAVVPLVVLGGMGAVTVTAVLWAAWTGVAQAAALGLQVGAQRSIPPGASALILLLVPVFGAALAMVLVGDRLGVRELFGAALIVLAVIVGEVLPSRRRDVTHL